MKNPANIVLAALALCASLTAFAAPGAVVPLGDARFQTIHEGETQQEVRDELGAPSSTTKRDGETHYVYNYLDTWGMRSVFDVTFDADGHVEKKTELRVHY
jgi:outer membrane protein assembly factor BamE (lipoprotein component of BamABCDE complex)